MVPAPQSNQFAQNSGVGLGVSSLGAVTLWVFNCLVEGRIIPPDQTVVLMLSGYFYPVGIALRDFVLAYLRKETVALDGSAPTQGA
jgi:hypothetical protein